MIKETSITLWAPFTGAPLVDVDAVHSACTCLAGAAGAYLKNLPVALSPATARDPAAVRVWAERLGEPATWGSKRQVAVGAFADPFHPDLPWTFIARVFDTMLAYPQHEFNLLTLRPATATRFWRSLKTRQVRYEIPEHIRFGVVLSGSPLDPERVRAVRDLPTRMKSVIDLADFSRGNWRTLSGHGLLLG